jgi:hypothetical protein
MKMSNEEFERLERLVYYIGDRYDANRIRYLAHRTSNELGISYTKLLRWMELVAELSKIPCETGDYAFRTMTPGTKEFRLAVDIVRARNDLLKSME